MAFAVVTDSVADQHATWRMTMKRCVFILNWSCCQQKRVLTPRHYSMLHISFWSHLKLCLATEIHIFKFQKICVIVKNWVSKYINIKNLGHICQFKFYPLKMCLATVIHNFKWAKTTQACICAIWIKTCQFSKFTSKKTWRTHFSFVSSTVKINKKLGTNRY